MKYIWPSKPDGNICRKKNKRQKKRLIYQYWLYLNIVVFLISVGSNCCHQNQKKPFNTQLEKKGKNMPIGGCNMTVSLLFLQRGVLWGFFC